MFEELKESSDAYKDNQAQMMTSDLFTQKNDFWSLDGGQTRNLVTLEEITRLKIREQQLTTSLRKYVIAIYNKGTKKFVIRVW